MSPRPLTASRAAVAGWILFEWAVQPFFTLVTTFVYAPYFAASIAGDPTRGQALWGFATAAAGFSIALLAPALGAIADAAGHRKPWIAGFSALLCLASALLWPGQAGGCFQHRARARRLCARRGRRAMRARVLQQHDAEPRAARAARAAVRHRVGDRLCGRPDQPRAHPRVPRREPHDRQDAARPPPPLRPPSPRPPGRPRPPAAYGGVGRR